MRRARVRGGLPQRIEPQVTTAAIMMPLTG
jgi:hypothetical protein